MMATSRRALLGGAAATLAAPALIRAQGLGTVKVGEINSYSTVPAFTEPYRKGWQLALSMANELGGIDGRKLEFISRDDAGRPEDAVRLATELVTDAKVDLLAGGYLSNVGLAVSAYALQAKKLYVAGEPLTDALTWSKGNRYTYRIRPSTYMQAAMLVEEAVKLPAKRWVTVAPNYEYGQSAVSWFKQLLSARRPDVTFVGEQWPALGHVDAGATVNALGQAGPDAIFNALFGTDLVAFVRQGNTRGLFENRAVVSLLTGEPEYLDALGDETPPGWIVTGYPWGQSDEPSNKQFVLNYESAYHEPPKMGSVVGYTLVNAIVSGVAKSGGTDSEAMAVGFADATFTTPFGICRFRPIDHQSTLGTYVGRTAMLDGKGGMVGWHYVDGAGVMPPDSQVRSLRPDAT